MARARVVLRPLTRPATGSDLATESGRAFLQERLALLAKIWFFWSGSLLLLTFGLPLLGLGEPRPFLIRLPFGGVMIVSLGCWLVCRRGERSLPALKSLDVGMLFVGCVVSTLHSLMDRPEDYYTNVVPLIVFMAVLSRAIFVPSTPLRTWWASLAVAASAISVAVTLQPPEITPLIPATRATVWSVIFSLCAVVVATLASWVIYGLRREIRKAQQLGQYTLEEKIGEGGMGTVYRARHAMLRRPTAVKLIRSDQASDSMLARFEREVQLTSSLSHPNTVAIYDFGHTPAGVFYYAMEYLPGLSLEALVKTDGPQPERRVVHVLRQVCGALAEAHAIGLIHRDIKPANIMLCERGGVYDVAKVLDFGLVKELDGGSDQQLTGIGTIAGTPLYLAPEAIQAPERVDARSDLYAVGAVAYFLVTGEQVFEGHSAVELMAHHLHTAPVRPSERAGREIDDGLERIILRCLAKDVDDRPADAGALVAELDSSLGVDVGVWTKEEAREWWETKAGACFECELAAKRDVEPVECCDMPVDVTGRVSGAGGEGRDPTPDDRTSTRPAQSWLQLWR
jgi:hypothetical protein